MYQIPSQNSCGVDTSWRHKDVEDVFVYQDKQSAILLKINGFEYIGKDTRHVKNKYFFATDKIKD